MRAVKAEVVFYMEDEKGKVKKIKYSITHPYIEYSITSDPSPLVSWDLNGGAFHEVPLSNEIDLHIRGRVLDAKKRKSKPRKK